MELRISTILMVLTVSSVSGLGQENSMDPSEIVDPISTSIMPISGEKLLKLLQKRSESMLPRETSIPMDMQRQGRMDNTEGDFDFPDPPPHPDGFCIVPGYVCSKLRPCCRGVCDRKRKLCPRST